MTTLAGYEPREGILVPVGSDRTSAYRQQWEREAEEDAIRAATARPGAGREDYEALTVKISDLWRRFTPGRRFRSVLEVGCGYGRVPLFLGRERSLRCDRYVGIDISEAMLRRFRGYEDEFRALGDAEVLLVCTSAERLPLSDESVDLALSSAVFLHMGKRFVAASLAEVARVLRPGGSFAFEGSFLNAHCTANLPGRLRGAVPFRRRPNRIKYWTRDEVERVLEGSGLADLRPDHRIEPTATRLVPTGIGRFRVPLSHRLNAALSPLPTALRPLTDLSYRVYTPDLTAG